MCEWCGRPSAASLLCPACAQADAEMARAEMAAEMAEARRVRAWHAQRERQMVSLGDGGTAEHPPF